MLRRRSRTPKTPKPGSASRFDPKGSRDVSAPGSRRRARPDVTVPAELKVTGRITHVPMEERVRKPGGEVVLVTGFEPFDGEKTNPSWEVCKQLPPEIAGMRVETCRVPCEFRRSIEVVAEAIERHHPVIVLCIGQAGSRSRLGVERVGINVDDARIPDNAGYQPVDEMIAPNGPPAYFASLPVKAMAAAIRAAGVPAEVSNSAGTYVCNHLLYGVLHFLAASGHRARAGFIHVPYSEAQAIDKHDVPGMAVASMTKGIQAAIVAAREHRHDLQLADGALD
jgi:pyroglutamyl-peptidase